MTTVDLARDAARLAATNKKAWDDLYGTTELPVWGRLPIGFLTEFLGHAAPVLCAGRRALDAGTGEGRNVEPLERTGAWVTVCDASPRALSKVRRLVQQRIGRVQCDLAMLPYRDATFDFVLMTDVIETLPNPDPALAEANRVLAPGGMLLCNIPGRMDPIAGPDMLPVAEQSFLYRGKYFFRFMDAEDAAALIRRHGFDVLRGEQRSWFEDAHPAFRAAPHRHISNVFLARKT